MAIPNILLVYVHRAMCVGLFYRYGFRQAGCRVRTMGPSSPQVYNHDFPPEDYEPPTWEIPSAPMDAVTLVESARAQGFNPDALVVVDQYDPLFVTGECSIPWATVCIENFNAEQLSRYQQRKGAVEFHCISHFKDNETAPPPDSEFLPFAFDPYIQPLLGLQRDKVVCQIGTHYQPRPAVWNGLRAALDNEGPLDPETYGGGLQETPSTLFGKVFSHAGAATAYNRSRITISASNCDFLPMRIFEAFAMGCVLVSDDQPILRKYIGQPYDEPNYGMWFAHDGTVDGIVDTVMKVSRLPDAVWSQIVSCAFGYAASQHTYAHRAKRILTRLGLQGATRMVTD